MSATVFAVAALLTATCASGNVLNTPAEKPDPVFQIGCDFDDGANSLCHYSNNKADDFNWYRSQKFKLEYFGPKGDHTTGSGFFLIARGNTKDKPSIEALLDSPIAVAHPNGSCVTFWYYMYVNDIGSLGVYTSASDELGPVRWSRSGYSPVNGWMRVSLGIAPGNKFKVTFKYTLYNVGNPVYRGDVAIDDISLAEGLCQDTPTVITDPVFQIGCDFDSDAVSKCHYSNNEGNDFNWERLTGYISRTYYGPHADHTTGSGHYLYAKGPTNAKPSDVARLDSPIAVADYTGSCVTFWYHMYEAGNSSLSVYTSDESDNLGPVRWSRSGYTYTKDDQWMQASLGIAPGNKFKVTFIMQVGNGHQGGIAIDDISLAEGQCKGQPSCD